MRITILFALLVTVINTSGKAQTLKPSDADSKISFIIKNIGLDVTGSLTGLAGTMVFDPAKLSSCAFDVRVNASTINTNNTKRDNHLKSDDFFDVEKFPTISIKTKSIQAKGKNVYFTKAVLTIHGVSKDIQFDFIATPVTNGYNFSAGFTINRLDYGVGGNSMTMADDVRVRLNVVGKK